ncbi:MAG: hypothetical protein ACI4F1_04480 [Bariatricus sp.]
MDDLAQYIEDLSTIIQLQAETINDIFKLLLQHITAEEADSLPVVKKINLAAELRKEIGG